MGDKLAINTYLVDGPRDKWKQFFVDETTMSWIHGKGIHFLASVKDSGSLLAIYVTICPIYTMRKDLSPDCLDEYLASQIHEVLWEFFGEREFLRVPDSKKSRCKHYFSII